MVDDSTDLLFKSLAHAARRRMLDLVQHAPGMTVKALSSHFDMTRIAVLKHLRQLEAADLILSKKRGRERHLYFNPVPIQQIYDRWTDRYSAFFAGRLVDMKDRVERQEQRKDQTSA